MSSNYLAISDDICAQASAKGMGAIAVIRVSGQKSLEKLASAFSRPQKILDSPGYNAVYGNIIFKNQEKADEVVAVIFRNPKSYTGQDSADIMCHGGKACIVDVLSCLYEAGFRQALPGEFTFRAFYNGKMDLARAEAVGELISARTRQAKNDAMTRLQGSLSKELLEIKNELLRLAASCALRLDYGEDETPEDIKIEEPKLDELLEKTKALCSSYKIGKILKDGAVIAFAGRTNAGKSSIFNKLLKEDRAIVSDIPGTTRDYIEAELNLDGIPLRIIDTAGVRESTDPIEQEGLKRSLLLAESADVLAYVVDGSIGLTKEDISFIEEKKAQSQKIILIWNKTDKDNAKNAPKDFVSMSVKNNFGFKDFAEAVKKELSVEEQKENANIIHLSSQRHKECLEKVIECLKNAKDLISTQNVAVDMLAVEFSVALDALGQISGETTREDILDSLFSNFCVGK